ncbi:MAG: hypothetical protein ACRDA3_02265 [Peptostreptococcaceae bacterium]
MKEKKEELSFEQKIALKIVQLEDWYDEFEDRNPITADILGKLFVIVGTILVIYLGIQFIFWMTKINLLLGIIAGVVIGVIVSDGF